MKGLTKDEVKESRARYGENLITPPHRDPLWKLFLEKFSDPVIRVLLIAAFLSLGIAFVEQEFAETIGIFCAILLATGVAFWFEYDAEKKFDMLGRVEDDTNYKVVRDGKLGEVSKKDIVVGDTVVLETGEEIPADGRLSESLSMSVNESTLTGEPVISKSADPEQSDDEATYPSYMLMRGTSVTEGHGTMVVTAVGDATEFGKTARQATIKPDEKTPLNLQLESLAKFIGVAGFSLAFFTFVVLFLKDIILSTVAYAPEQLWLLGVTMVSLAVMMVKIWVPIVHDGMELMGRHREVPRFVSKWGWFAWVAMGLAMFVILAAAGFLFFGVDPTEGGSWVSLDIAKRLLQYFMVAVTLIVVAVPEGLPMSVTLSLALSMRRMLKSNNLVRKMHACETMGAATVICTDKTGTLTQNRMSVHDTCFFAMQGRAVSDDAEICRVVREGIALNSTAFIDKNENGVASAIGNPTEGALLLWLDAAGVSYEPLRESVKIIDQLPFSTERKFMATLVDSQALGRRVIYMKGAPEIIFAKCANVLTDSGEVAADDLKKSIFDTLLGYQNRAMRTLGFAYAVVDDGVADCGEALEKISPVFLGVAAIADPIREDVPEAVAKCLRAGIAVKIVTGDTPATAKEIGRQIGLWGDSDGDFNHLTGVEFEALSDDELLGRVQSLKIMSRARPTDKQRLVQLLQRCGEVVAVTGDGTNDAPALNFAQVGLSMGTGTSVAKEASDITLLDDSFNSIATAVMWGRSLYRNIQRFVVFQLTINFTALVVVLLGSIFGAELPLTVTQMLWVNLIMDTFAAGALASLPPDPRVMNDRPRRSSDFIITRSMGRTIVTVGTLFVLFLVGMLLWYGHDISVYDLSVFFTVFVMLQFWNMFNAKAFGSDASTFKGIGRCLSFLSVLVIILIGQYVIVTYAGGVFRTEPIAALDWVKIIAGTSVVLWVGEVSRFISRRRK